MPILTLTEFLQLSELDTDYANMLGGISKRSKKISDSLDSLGNEYKGFAKALNDVIRKMRDQLKLYEIIAREDGSTVSQSEVDDFKKEIKREEVRLRKIELFYDALKDLAIAKKSVLPRIDEYSKSIKEVAKVRSKMSKKSQEIEGLKSKMVPIEKITKVEDTYRDIERVYEQGKRSMEKKHEAWLQEREEVNSTWKKFADNVVGLE